MLVLSRKIGESINIDGRITVTVVKVGGGKVRLGIEAPKEVRILRGELDQWQTLSGAESASGYYSPLATEC